MQRGLLQFAQLGGPDAGCEVAQDRRHVGRRVGGRRHAWPPTSLMRTQWARKLCILLSLAARSVWTRSLRATSSMALRRVVGERPALDSTSTCASVATSASV